MKNNIFYITILFFLIPTLAMSQDRKEISKEEQSEISATLNAFTRNISSIQANFVQEKVFSFMEDKLIAQGLFLFVSPDKIRWEYQKPYPYIIIMSDGKMQVNDEGDMYSMDMRSNQLFQQMNTLITKSIKGELLSESMDYDQTFYKDDQYYIVSFSPKNPQLRNYLSAIEIYFSKENGQVLALKMIEAAGDYTFIKFYKRIENMDINPDYFKLFYKQ
ncbi:MAG: outer membrane lipoprotein carrier protein LolA [Bacteroidales bacterium]|nr:outer membrane lipoprotein carrier protein LolA [Bacteroidales bacterium]